MSGLTPPTVPPSPEWVAAAVAHISTARSQIGHGDRWMNAASNWPPGAWWPVCRHFSAHHDDLRRLTGHHLSTELRLGRYEAMINTLMLGVFEEQKPSSQSTNVALGLLCLANTLALDAQCPRHIARLMAQLSTKDPTGALVQSASGIVASTLFATSSAYPGVLLRIHNADKIALLHDVLWANLTSDMRAEVLPAILILHTQTGASLPAICKDWVADVVEQSSQRTRATHKKIVLSLCSAGLPLDWMEDLLPKIAQNAPMNHVLGMLVRKNISRSSDDKTHAVMMSLMERHPLPATTAPGTMWGYGGQAPAPRVLDWLLAATPQASWPTILSARPGLDYHPHIKAWRQKTILTSTAHNVSAPPRPKLM